MCVCVCVCVCVFDCVSVFLKSTPQKKVENLRIWSSIFVAAPSSSTPHLARTFLTKSR